MSTAVIVVINATGVEATRRVRITVIITVMVHDVPDVGLGVVPGRSTYWTPVVLQEWTHQIKSNHIASTSTSHQTYVQVIHRYYCWWVAYRHASADFALGRNQLLWPLHHIMISSAVSHRQLNHSLKIWRDFSCLGCKWYKIMMFMPWLSVRRNACCEWTRSTGALYISYTSSIIANSRRLFLV